MRRRKFVSMIMALMSSIFPAFAQSKGWGKGGKPKPIPPPPPPPPEPVYRTVELWWEESGLPLNDLAGYRLLLDGGAIDVGLQTVYSFQKQSPFAISAQVAAYDSSGAEILYSNRAYISG